MTKVKDKVIEMILTLAAVDTLEEARAECLFSGHLFDKHIFQQLELTPEQGASIAFTLGRSCQLGVLFGVLWHTNNFSDEQELKAKEMFKQAIKEGNAEWRGKE